jgi:anti-sigma B factor antagonist
MLNISERHSGEMTILDLEGNVIMGGGSAKLREAVAGLIKDGKTNILLNFQNVKYIDSSGVGELISGSEALSELDGTLKLINLPPKVEQVLTLTGILPIFEVYDDEASALSN